MNTNDPTGIKWPLQLAHGRVALSSGDQHVKESLMQVIGICRGEYLLRPDFGSNLRRRVFDPVNLAPLMQHDVVEAIRLMEPRVELVDVTVRAGQ